MVVTTHLYKNEWYINKITHLLQTLDIIPNTLNNYLLAFVHRSLVNEKPDLSSENNERLEFLWDAVLELVITTKLFNDYPFEPEGRLTDYRSSIVKWKHLSNVARSLGFGEYLILWKWEEMGGWRESDYLLADTLEAFIWAYYLDKWYQEVQEFILENIYKNLEEFIQNEEIKDYKSLIQELSQDKYSITPVYQVLSESWLDHEKKYVSGVFLREACIGQGEGSSKKKSQEEAAKNAYLERSWQQWFRY